MVRSIDDNLNLEQERPSDRFRDYLNREKINNVMNGVIRASSLRETALNRLLPGSDISMIAELALRGKFVEIPDRLFVRRLTPETTILLMGAIGEVARLSGLPGQPPAAQAAFLSIPRRVAGADFALGQSARVALSSAARRLAAPSAMRKVFKLLTGRG